MSRKLFGLPYGSLKKVQQVDESTALFLFNHTTKVMHGVYICDGRGGLNLEPDAWAHHRKNPTERTSPYPAQLRFKTYYPSKPMAEKLWTHIPDGDIRHHGRNQIKMYKSWLSQSEAQQLVSLFINASRPKSSTA